MNLKESKKLKVGDRVLIWAEKPHACTGTVIETGYNAAKFEWDDGQTGVIHLRDMEDVSRYYGDTPIAPVTT